MRENEIKTTFANGRQWLLAVYKTDIYFQSLQKRKSVLELTDWASGRSQDLDLGEPIYRASGNIPAEKKDYRVKKAWDYTFASGLTNN